MIMKTNKTVKTTKTIESTNNDVAMTVADVARQLKIDPKTARAFLRKHVDLYVARKQRFTKTSALYKKTFDALSAYAQTRVVVTK